MKKMKNQSDMKKTSEQSGQDRNEYMRGGKGRTDDVRGSHIYPASSPDAPADAQVRTPGELVGHSKCVALCGDEDDSADRQSER